MWPLLLDFTSDLTDEVVRLWRESFEHGVGIVDPHPIEEQRQFLVEHVLPNYTVQVVFAAGQVSGFVAASAESINQLYVRVGDHRRGLGAMMLNWAKEQSNGTLWLYTFARNSNACAFYVSQGFEEVARGFEPNWQLEDVRYEWTR